MKITTCNFIEVGFSNWKVTLGVLHSLAFSVHPPNATSFPFASTFPSLSKICSNILSEVEPITIASKLYVPFSSAINLS